MCHALFWGLISFSEISRGPDKGRETWNTNSEGYLIYK